MPQWRQLEAGQRSRLHIVSTDGTDQVIHESDAAVFEAPNWAADSSIVFNQDGWLYRWVAGEVARIDTSVADFNNDHVLDPDGLHIFATSEDGHIYRAPLSGGEAVKVTRDDDGLMAHYLHGVSPDGTVLLHIGGSARAEGAVYNIYAFNLETGTTTALTDSPKPHDGSEFSPDGQWVYFNAERNARVAGHAQLFRMRPDAAGIEQLTSDVRVNWFPHLSPDGRLMTYISFPAGTLGHPANVPVQIVLTDASAQAEAWRIDAFGGQGCLNVNSWAPDSTRFAYVDYPMA
jgi:WD40 repeat protein